MSATNCTTTSGLHKAWRKPRPGTSLWSMHHPFDERVGHVCTELGLSKNRNRLNSSLLTKPHPHSSSQCPFPSSFHPFYFGAVPPFQAPAAPAPGLPGPRRAPPAPTSDDAIAVTFSRGAVDAGRAPEPRPIAPSTARRFYVRFASSCY